MKHAWRNATNTEKCRSCVQNGIGNNRKKIPLTCKVVKKLQVHNERRQVYEMEFQMKKSENKRN